MFLKRKRSESELSLSSSSALGSPSRHDAAATTMDMATLRIAAPAHLPSRTMKRFRDSRPSDAEVHRKFYEWRAHHHHLLQNQGQSQSHSHSQSQSPLQSSSFSRDACTERTLNMLYTAQKQPPHHPPAAFTFAQPPPPPPSAHSQAAQASLHKFWNLPNPEASCTVSSPPVDRSLYAPASCEDCGQGLGGASAGSGGGGGGDAMDVDSFDMDVETGCSACGKHVCSHCSITNLGEQRRCLICAGKKVWVGGVGWTTGAGVPVC